MLAIVVFTQTLPVIGQENDHGALVDVERLELLEQIADHRIGSGDFGIVRRAVAGPERFGRTVGRVRLVNVKEEEEWLVSNRAEPLCRSLQRMSAGSLGPARSDTGGRVLDQIFVEIEVRIQPDRSPQDPGGDGGAGGIAQLLEDLGQIRNTLRVQNVTTVVANTMLGWQQPGEDRGVRRQRQRDVRVGMSKEDRIVAQPGETPGSRRLRSRRRAIGRSATYPPTR